MYCLTVYYLVSWTEEEALSTVSEKAIVREDGRPLPPGSLYQVRTGGKLHPASVIASGIIIGSRTCM